MSEADIEQLERRKNVAERYLRGQTQWQIARSLEVGQATVSRDLAAIRKEWLALAVRDFGERQAEELARVEFIEREALLAWERSKAERQSTRTRRRTRHKESEGDAAESESGESEAELRKEQRDGNPKFLELALRCVERRCELTGLLERAGGVGAVVTVIGGIDLQVVLGHKPGIARDQIGNGG